MGMSERILPRLRV